MLRFQERHGKSREIPVRPDLQRDTVVSQRGRQATYGPISDDSRLIEWNGRPFLVATCRRQIRGHRVYRPTSLAPRRGMRAFESCPP